MDQATRQAAKRVAEVTAQPAVLLAGLRDGDYLDSCFYITDKALRKTRTGDGFITMTLRDASGSVKLIKFQAGRELFDSFEGFNSCHARGRVESYNGVLQIKAESIEPARQEELQPGAFVPSTPHDVEQLEQRLRAIYATMDNAFARQLLLAFLDDAELSDALKLSPAATRMHHPVRGGLLEHVVSMTELADKVCAHYPQVDRNLVFAGVLLHDIGKVRELKIDQEIDYTDEGQLIGHINIGLELIDRHADTIEDFPAELRMLAKHMVLAHHGRLEWGSPKLPMTLEAQLVHYIDNIDAKVNAYLKAVADSPGGAHWTDKVPAFEGRKMYKGPGTLFYTPESSGTADV